MKISRKKFLALAAASAAATATTACGATQSSSSSVAASSVSSSSEANANPYAEQMEISYLTHYCTGLPETFELKTRLEEEFNVKISIPDIDLNADFDTFQLKITSGEMPDYVMMNKDGALVRDWYDQEVIREIPYEWIREYAPNYSKVMDEDPAGWDIYKNADDDKTTLAMSGYMPEQQYMTFWLSYYRLDWLEKLGIKPNGTVKPVDEKYDYLYYTDEAFTIEQQMEIFDKFKNGDPDGNGENDTTPMAGYTEWVIHNLQAIAGAFGIAGDYNFEEDGMTVEYYASKRWKEFLKHAKTMYANGYMDKEWFNNDWGTLGEKYATGKYGYIASSSTYVADESQRDAKGGMWGRAPLNMIADDPNGKILVCPPEIGPDGHQNSHLKAISPFRYQFIFSKDCSDEKVKRILAMMDYSMFSKEGFETFFYGIEGTHYTIGDNGVGDMVYLPDSELGKLGAPGGRAVFAQNMFAPFDGRADLNTTPMNKAMSKFTKSDKWLEFSVGPKRYDLFGETEYDAVKSEYIANIDTIVKEFMANAIAGNIDIDAEWEDYLANLDKAGYPKILEALNTVPLYEDLFPGSKSVK